MSTLIPPMRPVSAHTSHPNTPETDRDRTVEHDVMVVGADGMRETVRLHATDPMNAIDLVRWMVGSPAYAALPRVPE
jgi:hypothetical protein